MNSKQSIGTLINVNYMEQEIIYCDVTKKYLFE